MSGHLIAGTPLSWWIGFHMLVLALLAVDLVFLGRRPEGPRFRGALLWTIFLAMLAVGFAGFILHTEGKEKALEFLSGYVLEGSLSVDNLFVFLLLFDRFGLSAKEQHQALLYGIGGAIVLRAFFIVAGVTLLERFAFMEYIFGALLLYAAWGLLRPSRNHETPNVSRWIEERGWHISPLLLAILTIEVTDVVFAIDSVPAVLGVTHDTFIVYTSNIFAILGLRSLYFVLQNLLGRLHLLHYGLGLILAFVGGKMIVAHWIGIPTIWSLGIILGIVAIFSIASLLVPQRVH